MLKNFFYIPLSSIAELDAVDFVLKTKTGQS